MMIDGVDPCLSLYLHQLTLLYSFINLLSLILVCKIKKIWGQSNVESPIKEFILTCDAVEDLVAMYKMLYPPINIIHVYRVSRRVQKVSMCAEIISSVKGHTYKNSCVSQPFGNHLIRKSSQI